MKQPEALQVADDLVALHCYPLSIKAAQVLRRLYAQNAHLLEALKMINDCHPCPSALAGDAIAAAEGEMK